MPPSSRYTQYLRLDKAIRPSSIGQTAAMLPCLRAFLPLCFRVMDEHRACRQHIKTDALLGVEAVPIRPVAASAMSPHLDRDQKSSILRQIDEQEVRSCTKCGLCKSRTQSVFGEGDPDAPVLFIGEGPGKNEDEQGRPFVGRAGQLLSKMITAMGFQREQFYIANVVKCRPPQNRTPTPDEVSTCWDFLRRQIQIIQPKVIVTLGAPATRMVLETKEGITRIRGTWHEYQDMESGIASIPVMPTFHPAYLLRAYTMENRKKVWSDLQAVIDRIAQ